MEHSPQCVGWILRQFSTETFEKHLEICTQTCDLESEMPHLLFLDHEEPEKYEEIIKLLEDNLHSGSR